MTHVDHFLATDDVLGEGPLWHPVEQMLYWVDIESGVISRCDPSLGQQTTIDRVPIGQKVGALAFMQPAGFLIAAERGIGMMPEWGAPIQWRDEALSKPTGDRFNDGAVDRRGRFWVGAMSSQPENNLYRFDTDGRIQIMQRGLTISNGIGWSPDNRLMYLSDSGEGVIYVYDFVLKTGDIQNRRIFYRPEPDAGVADGLTVDSEGYIWAGFWDGWRVVRFAPDGTIDRIYQVPVASVTSCCFGGPDLDTLYITTARVGLTPEQLAQQPQAGHLFMLKPGVTGLPEPLAQWPLGL